MNLKIANIINDSIVDGPGLRLSVFAQGCFHNCTGCHNKSTHDINGGYYISTDEIINMIKKNPLLDGVTFTGGEPFLQSEVFSYLAKEIKQMNLSVICYSGFTYEQLIQNNDYLKLLQEVDILIDGPFMKDKKTLNLAFRGSANQRAIDVKKSLERKKIIEYCF